MGFREKLTLMRREYRVEAARLDDEMAATHVAVGQLRGDLQETARTMMGRSRLLENRFGKMLDVVGASLEDSIDQGHCLSCAIKE